VFKDSLTIDSIINGELYPIPSDDLLLRSFTSDFQRKYLQKSERNQREKLIVYFAAPTSEPVFEL
jgi:hypothetical protein